MFITFKIAIGSLKTNREVVNRESPAGSDPQRLQEEHGSHIIPDEEGTNNSGSLRTDSIGPEHEDTLGESVNGDYNIIDESLPNDTTSQELVKNESNNRKKPKRRLRRKGKDCFDCIQKRTKKKGQKLSLRKENNKTKVSNIDQSSQASQIIDIIVSSQKEVKITGVNSTPIILQEAGDNLLSRMEIQEEAVVFDSPIVQVDSIYTNTRRIQLQDKIKTLAAQHELQGINSNDDPVWVSLLKEMCQLHEPLCQVALEPLPEEIVEQYQTKKRTRRTCKKSYVEVDASEGPSSREEREAETELSSIASSLEKRKRKRIRDDDFVYPDCPAKYVRREIFPTSKSFSVDTVFHDATSSSRESTSKRKKAKQPKVKESTSSEDMISFLNEVSALKKNGRRPPKSNPQHRPKKSIPKDFFGSFPKDNDEVPVSSFREDPEDSNKNWNQVFNREGNEWVFNGDIFSIFNNLAGYHEPPQRATFDEIRASFVNSSGSSFSFQILNDDDHYMHDDGNLYSGLSPYLVPSSPGQFSQLCKTDQVHDVDKSMFDVIDSAIERENSFQKDDAREVSQEDSGTHGFVELVEAWFKEFYVRCSVLAILNEEPQMDTDHLDGKEQEEVATHEFDDEELFTEPIPELPPFVTDYTKNIFFNYSRVRLAVNSEESDLYCCQVMISKISVKLLEAMIDKIEAEIEIIENNYRVGRSKPDMDDSSLNDEDNFLPASAWTSEDRQERNKLKNDCNHLTKLVKTFNELYEHNRGQAYLEYMQMQEDIETAD